MITLPNGHVIDFVAASGALAYDGYGWPWERPLLWSGLLDPREFTVVTKTLTAAPRLGVFRWWCPWRSLRFPTEGVANKFGLRNPGLDWWCRRVGPRVSRARLPLIVSIHDESPAIVGLMAKQLNEFDIVGLELNVSCPNVGSDLADGRKAVAACEAARLASRHPLIVKLAVTHQAAQILPRLRGVVSAVAVNSVPWSVACAGRPNPFGTGGGVSGKAARAWTWPYVRTLRESSPVHVIAPGAWEEGDIESMLALGAAAISFGSVFLRYPWRPTAMVRAFRRRQLTRGGEDGTE